LLDADSAPLLCDALRANATLTSLELGSSMWRDAAISAALLGALTAHPSIRKLTCTGWYAYDDLGDAATAASAALGALIAANAPALESVSMHDSLLDDAGLGPLLNALPGNTHLQELSISGDLLTEDYMRDRLLPAVRANTSLRSLSLFLSTHVTGDSARKAMALVASRALQ
jgi:hypothetical protein